MSGKQQISRRKFLKLASVSAAGIALASCAPKVASTPQAVGGNTVAAPTVVKSTLKISMYYPTAVDGPLAKIFEGYAADFNKANSDIQVTTVYGGSYDDVRNKIMTEIKGGGETASIAIFAAADIATLVDSDIVLPVENFVNLDSDGKAYVADFYPGFLENNMVNGHLISIPFQRSLVLFYYNKDLLKGIGLDPEKSPATFQEMAQAAQKLTKPDGSRWGVEIPTDAWLLQPFAIANGQNIIGDARNKVYFNDPADVEGLTQWQQLITQYNAMPKGTLTYGDPTKHFVAGSTAMLYNSSGNMTSVLTQSQFNVGVGLCPAGSKGYGTVTGGGNLYIIKSNKSEQQQAGYRFIRFLTEPERVADWTIGTGYIANRKSAWDTNALKQLISEKPQYAAARDQLQYAKKELDCHQYSDVADALNRAIQAVVSGEKEPKPALDDAQKEADQILVNYKD